MRYLFLQRLLQSDGETSPVPLDRRVFFPYVLVFVLYCRPFPDGFLDIGGHGEGGKVEVPAAAASRDARWTCRWLRR